MIFTVVVLSACLGVVPPCQAEEGDGAALPGASEAAAVAEDEGLRAIRERLAEDDYAGALELADAWIEQHPHDGAAVDAFFLRAKAKVGMRRYFEALYDYEAVIRDYPASPRYHEAIEHELSIAELFAGGLKRRFLGMRILSAAEDAEEIFIRTQERAPGSALGERASWALANYYYDRAHMTSAVEAYDLFLLNYPRSVHREVALMRLIEANLATFRGPKFDPTGLIEAAQRIKTFQQHHPAAAQRMDASSLLVRIDELLALKIIHIAKWYEQRDEKRSAVVMYQRAVRDYPQTAAGQDAVRRLLRLGANPVEPPTPQPHAGAAAQEPGDDAVPLPEE